MVSDLGLQWCTRNSLANIRNTLNYSQPTDLSYLRSLPTCSLRSLNTTLLSVPRVRATVASRGYSVTAPTPWNSIPSGIHTCSSSHTFRRRPKTHCFEQACSSPWRLTQMPQIRPFGRHCAL